jgi:hypothetical protein
MLPPLNLLQRGRCEQRPVLRGLGWLGFMPAAVVMGLLAGVYLATCAPAWWWASRIALKRLAARAPGGHDLEAAETVV